MTFSHRAKNLKGSATMAATIKAQERIKNGEDIILASVGEPDIAAPNMIKNELSYLIQNFDSKYGPAPGLLSTRKSVCHWMNTLYQQNWIPENVVLAPGSKYSLYSLLQILGDEETELIIPSPYWVSYVTLGKLANMKIKIIDCSFEEGYKISAEKLSNALKSSSTESNKIKSQLLLLNSPQNPTGAIYSHQELTAIAEVVKANPQLLVICDDIYNQLIFSDELRAPHLLDQVKKSDLQEIKKQIIVVHGASKSLSLTGWRLGWTMAPPEIASKLTEFQSQTLTCMPDFLQLALEKTLEQNLPVTSNTDKSDFVGSLRNLIRSRYQRSVAKLKHCPGIRIFPSEGAFYIWFEILDKSKTSAELTSELLEDAGVAVVPGSSFGCEYHLRFSVTIEDSKLDKGIDRIITFFTQKSKKK